MADEPAAPTARYDNEREMLLTRINHLDTLALAARAIAVPATILATIASVGSSDPAMQSLLGDSQFVLPLSLITAFYLIEERIRRQYKPCKDRWQLLIETAGDVKTGRFDWIKTKPARFITKWGEFRVLYCLLATVVVGIWLVKRWPNLFGGLPN